MTDKKSNSFRGRITGSITATYDKDSKRFHCYIIDEGQEVVGNIYIPKDSVVPKSVTIDLKLKDA